MSIRWRAPDLRFRVVSFLIQEWNVTAVDVCFRYKTPPGEAEMVALTKVRDIYGIRRLSFDEQDRTVRVEFDATRLNEEMVANILRRTGLDLGERLQLA